MNRCVLFLSFCTIAFRLHADPLQNWYWRNPLPSANSLRSICFAQGKFVAVGNGGLIHTSTDGLNWDAGRRPVTNTLFKVIFGNSQFLAVGTEGAILTSSNGYDWQAQVSGTTNPLFAVAFGNGKFIAAGSAGQLCVSSNGSSWMSSSVGTDDLAWVAAGNGAFLVRGQDAMTVRTSSDLQSWTTSPLPYTIFAVPPALHEVLFANGIFVGAAFAPHVINNRTTEYAEWLYTSTNGLNWIASAVVGQDFPNGTRHRFLSFANGSFMDFLGQDYYSPGAQDSRLARTSDGTSLSISFAPAEAWDAVDLAGENGRYVLLGTAGKQWQSTDGTSWIQNYGGFRSTVHQVISAEGKYLAVADAQPILRCSDGLHFTPLNTPADAFHALAFDGSNYVAVGKIAGSAALYTSTNGIDWLPRTSNGGNNPLTSVCRGLNRWVVVGMNGTVLSSPTATAWSLRTSGTANSLNSVAFGNSTYVAVGNAGTIITSADGTTWDAQDSGTTAALKRVQWLAGLFYAVGENGTILTSIDGLGWQSQTSGTTATLNGICVGDGKWVACGSRTANQGFLHIYNVFLQSTNGTQWQDVTTKIPLNVPPENIAFLNDSFWLCGQNGALLQSDSVGGVPVLATSLSPDKSLFQLQIVLNAPSGYRIQASTAGSAWQDVVNVSNAVSPFVWGDTNGVKFGDRLYRLVSP